MNLFKRGMFFLTFCGCCVAMACIIAGLGTKNWVNAKAKRTTNPHESEGKINFGLFEGKKELNVAYGWRSYDIDVVHLIKYEPELMIYSYWLGTIVCLCIGLLFNLFGAISAAVNSAIKTSSKLSGIGGLYAANIIALLVNVGAVLFWIAQFFMKIQSNVLTREDKDNMWTSEDMAELGYSFWFAVGAAVANLINLIILVIISSEEEKDSMLPMLEEKTNGAIMLY